MMTLYEFFKEEAEIMGKYANGELVEVVRCKDCERVSFDYHDEQYPCFCDKWLQGVEYDDYCSKGERKNDDER